MKRCLVWMIIALLAGCSARARYELDENNNTRLETRAFLRSCIVTEPAQAEFALLAALAAAALPALIDATFDLTASALQEAGKEEKVQSIAVATSHFYERIGGELGTVATVMPFGPICLIVARGKFASGEYKSVSYKQDDARNYWNDTSRKTGLSKIGLVEPPLMFLEAHLKLSEERSAFQIVPAFLEYAAPAKGRLFSTERDLVFSFAFTNPGAKGDERTFGATAITFDHVTPFMRLDGNALRGKESEWLPVPGMGESTAKRLETAEQRRATARSLAEQIAAKMVKNEPVSDSLNNSFNALKQQIERDDRELDRLVPYSATVTYIETAEAREFLVKAGEALAKLKEPAREAILDTAIESRRKKKEAERAAAEETRQVALEDADTKALDAMNAVETAQLDLSAATAAPEIKKAELSLRKAKLAANHAFRRAGRDIPFPEVFAHPL